MKQIIFRTICALLLAAAAWFTNWLGFGLITGNWHLSDTLQIIFAVAFVFGFMIVKVPKEYM